MWKVFIVVAWSLLFEGGSSFHPTQISYNGARPRPSRLLSKSSDKQLPEDTDDGATLTSGVQLNNAYSGPTGPGRYSDMLEEKGSFISRLLSPRPLPIDEASSTSSAASEENEDGWSDMRRIKRWKTIAKLPGQLYNKLLFDKPFQEPGTLILVRHGESTWNANQTFTGWSDYSDLSERGQREVEHAARLLLEGGYEIDVVFTSRLKRAIRSTWIMLEELNELYLPVFKSWRLNERHYGALTGLNKKETAEQLGHEQVQEWRGSLHARPPPVRVGGPFWPGYERKYADLSLEQLPLTESLYDCMKRTEPIWEKRILYELRNGKNVMVVAHANTLRGLVKTIDNISDEDIQNVAIPTGIPIVYKFDKNMKAIKPENKGSSQQHMHGVFLEKPGLLAEALKREEEWSKQVPGYNPTMGRTRTPMGTLERSLYKLQAEREMEVWANQFVDPNAPAEDDGTDGNMGRPIQLVDHEQSIADLKYSSSAQLNNMEGIPVTANLFTSSQPCVTSMPSPSMVPGLGEPIERRDAVIVIIRHGKTEHNKLGLFTGWEDAPLAEDGVKEAREAGKLLKAHGFQFDIVYSSWLSRALATAWHVLDEMDLLWLPIVKTWRLNERMYGQLTGLSKKMVKQRHGETQFKAWRRGFNTPPPQVSSFSQHYPGNDRRYVKYLNDVRYSVRESLIRSIEGGRPTLHRKLPKSESLKDCMDRTIPFFTERIVPEAIKNGQRVLISSSENAIRGLLMHLCDIPEEDIVELEIPNGLPIIYDIKSKCVKLLDTGNGKDPLEEHNFGNAAKYLFRPCLNEDGSPDEECGIRFVGDEPVVLSEEEVETIAAIKRGSGSGESSTQKEPAEVAFARNTSDTMVIK